MVSASTPWPPATKISAAQSAAKPAASSVVVRRPRRRCSAERAPIAWPATVSVRWAKESRKNAVTLMNCKRMALPASTSVPSRRLASLNQ